MRYLSEIIKEVLSRKMVFLGGPRQVGKTTLARSFLSSSSKEGSYLNWDYHAHQQIIMQNRISFDHETLIFDEIHKYARWRNTLKGIFDVHKETTQILVTGSARLDYYRKGGDSLVGRYRYFRLHPLSWPELTKFYPNHAQFNRLLLLGGFPEPFFLNKETELKLWQKDRQSKIIKEDLRDLEFVREVSLVELLVELLPSRVGAPLSIDSLQRDLDVSHQTVKRWIEILERLYMCFRIPPYGSKKIRAVKKEQKLYLWDWSVVESPGVRFENMVASHLLKLCHFKEDTLGVKMELRYLRDVMKKEIDFVVLQDNKPLFAVECKLTDTQLSPHIKYFKERTPIPKFYQVHTNQENYGNAATTGMVCSFQKFCELENLV